MIIQLEQVLSEMQVQAVLQLLGHGEFASGKETAGWHAKTVKDNLQWQGEAGVAEELDHCLTGALAGHEDFAGCAYAKDMMPFIVSESTGGGGYGDHIDDALMHSQHIVRTDLSCTIFLSEPDEYEGGELIMNYSGLEMAIKLRAGDAILYPSTTLHRVNPVTAGSRKVALTWMESHIRQAGQREMLFDLDKARKAIMKKEGKSDAFDLITKTHANLLRLWAET